MHPPPSAAVPRAPRELEWRDVPALSPFMLADGSGPAEQTTLARICHDGRSLLARFDCQDRDIWGTYTGRDDPLYEEEAVELFVAPGETDPIDYFEFEINPLGALFDARVRNPSSRRCDLQVDRAWDCPGIAWRAGADPQARLWWAEIEIPWSSLWQRAAPPEILRANLFRIERPRDGKPEFSCWSPTFTEPPDFHKPACFGVLRIER